MEELFTGEFLDPCIFLSGLNPNDIVDYVISSYTINISYIEAILWHPNIQIYCDKKNAHTEYIPKSISDHIHFIDAGRGIYHPKFILITTQNTLRLVITTCNFTKMILNCKNDYYRMTTKLKSSNYTKEEENECVFDNFLKHYGIKLVNNVTKYDWSNISANILVNIPYTSLTHANYFNQYTNNMHFQNIQIQTSAVSFYGWNPLNVLKTDHIEYVYLENYKDFTELNCYTFLNMIETEHIKKITKHCTTPYHYKRYILHYNDRSFFILTSANFTHQAWLGINTELGIMIELKNSYN